MDLAATSNLSQIIQNLAIAIAVIIGGVWAIYLHGRLRRERLSIECGVEVAQSAMPTGGMFVVSLAFRMKNAGARALQLVPDGRKPYDVPIAIRAKGMPWEKRAYRNCELNLWRLNRPTAGTDSLMSLLDDSTASKVRLSNQPINLLAESRINPATFWLEPEEVIHALVNLSLSPGYYVGQVLTIFKFRPISGRSAFSRYCAILIGKKENTIDTFTFAFEVPTLSLTSTPGLTAEGSLHIR